MLKIRFLVDLKTFSENRPQMVCEKLFSITVAIYFDLQLVILICRQKIDKSVASLQFSKSSFSNSRPFPKFIEGRAISRGVVGTSMYWVKYRSYLHFAWYIDDSHICKSAADFT